MLISYTSCKHAVPRFWYNTGSTNGWCPWQPLVAKAGDQSWELFRDRSQDWSGALLSSFLHHLLCSMLLTLPPKKQGISSAPDASLVFNFPLVCSRIFCSFAVPCAYLVFCSSTCKFCYLGYCLHFSHTSEEQIQCLGLPFWSLLCLHTYVKCLYIVFACAITVLQNDYTCCCLCYFDMLISGIKVS